MGEIQQKERLLGLFILRPILTIVIHCSEKASKKSHFAVKSLRILRFWTNVGHANKRVEPKGIEILESKKDQQGAICSLQWFVPKLL